VRQQATQLPGITSINDRNLADRDQLEFQQAKAALESASVYFLSSRDKLAPDALTGLSWLPDAIRRCQSAAKRVGSAITLEIRGSADASGSELKNIELSERRAQAVRDFLVSNGFEAAMLKPIASPALAPVAAGTDAVADDAARRVAFRVISEQ
jgi:outer membrane protein OmpA-like peptidoglycan-associated protein